MISTSEKSRLGKAATAGLATLAIALTGWIFLACAAEADPAATAAKPAESGSGGTVLATVEGKPITKAEVMASATEELEQAKMQLLQCESSFKQREHDVFETKTKQMVQDRMLDAEAGKRGMTKEAMLAAEVDAKIAEVSDADVDKFFEENQARIGNRPKETVAPQIKQYLGQQRQKEAFDGFIGSLEAKYAVAYSMEPFRVQVSAGNSPAMGPANAPVTIVIWSDFQCPFCSRVVPTIKQVEERYKEKVRIVFRQYPLPMHPQAQKAAEASLCANEQSKFWQLHDGMFADQQALAVDQLKAKAVTLGMDAGKFNECLDSNKHAKTVKDDMRDGSLVGVSGTPAMFINGRMLSGAQPFEEFAKIIDEELKMKGGM